MGIQTVSFSQNTQISGILNGKDKPIASATHSSVDKTTVDTSREQGLAAKQEVRRMAPVGVNINYLPLFGKYEKTEAQLIEDEIFKSDCDTEFETRNQASEFFTKMAWDYLGEGDKFTAIYRFNLSYLLNPENFDTFWGLGVIEYQNRNFDSAIDLMNHGLELSDGKNYVFMVDLATVYLTTAVQKADTTQAIERAKNLLSEAIRIQSQYTPAFQQMAVVNILQNQLDTAWENFHKACQLSPREINTEILRELLSRKDDPKGIFRKD